MMKLSGKIERLNESSADSILATLIIFDAFELIGNTLKNYWKKQKFLVFYRHTNYLNFDTSCANKLEASRVS